MAELRGQPLDLPELGGLRYLVEAMMRLGPVKSDGMGTRPADWPEIDAFARVTGRISDPWEAEALHAMCAGYLDELRAGADPLSVAPSEREGA